MFSEVEVKIMLCTVTEHYDLLIEEGNDPAYDPAPLKEYMNGWDGAPFLQALDLQSSDRALEIGVGTGRLALRTAPLCRSFTGIDLSPKTIARARENLRSIPHCNFICGDFLSHPFDNSFDVIYSSLTFMHIREKEKAVQRIFELLSSGGRMVISIDKNTSNILDMGSRQVQLYPDQPEKLLSFTSASGLHVHTPIETKFASIIVADKK